MRRRTGLKARERALLVQHALLEGPAAVSAAQRLRLLGDAQALSALADSLHSPYAHPQWAAVESRVADAAGNEAAARPQTRSAPQAFEIAEAR